MAERLRPALVRGRRAHYWRMRDDCLVLRTHDGLVEARIPVSDLLDEGRMLTHVARIDGWAPTGAVAELDAIIEGARQ